MPVVVKSLNVMVTHSKVHVVGLSLVLAVGSVAPCLAKVLGEDFNADGGLVRSFADDFTDAYHSTFLVIGGTDGGAIRVDHYASGAFSVDFWDQQRQYELPDDGAAVEIVFRVDALEAVTLTGTWSTRYKRAVTAVSEAWIEELADMVLGAETIIFRIGSKGEVRRVPVPAEMPELIAEFRRRVVAADAAAGEE